MIRDDKYGDRVYMTEAEFEAWRRRVTRTRWEWIIPAFLLGLVLPQILRWIAGFFS